MLIANTKSARHKLHHYLESSWVISWNLCSNAIYLFIYFWLCSFQFRQQFLLDFSIGKIESALACAVIPKDIYCCFRFPEYKAKEKRKEKEKWLIFIILKWALCTCIYCTRISLLTKWPWSFMSSEKDLGNICLSW